MGTILKSFFLIFAMLMVGDVYVGARNIIYNDNVKSLTAVVNGNWMVSPLLTLGSADVMKIGFDEMSHDYHRYVYILEHCEKDWTVSEGIFESDYISGFNGLAIEDYQNSINTNVLYTHYGFTFPNRQCSVKMSGNYCMKIVDEDNGSEVVAEVRFRVVEPVMSLAIEMTTNTDIDINKKHQQVNVSLDYGGINITNPDEELSLVVMQNNREETSRIDIPANYRNNRGMVWNHNRALIFDGGNEYHKFELLDVSHPTMGIDHIMWDGNAYQAYPFACQQSLNYLYDEDANGAFVIRNSDNVEVDYTCEYVYVNYELQCPVSEDLYIDGMWTTDADRSHYKMEYDAGSQSYRARILQKMGYYNYQYVTANGHHAPCEGTYYQTENSYQVYIYYKGTGARTWRLVGYRNL